jgi:arylsulfatase A-like enzyme
MNYGFDEFRGFVGGAVDYHTHVATHGLRELDWWRDRERVDEPGYAMDLLTRDATDFVARHRARPFFLYLSLPAPHVPWQSRDRGARESPAAIYREMITVLDESVGRLVATLRQFQLERNTLLLFCSDNGADPPRGVVANGRWRGKKGAMEEGGHRVPFIAAWPGVIPAGRVSAATVLTMDFFPTLLGLAGARPPRHHVVDGVDLAPLLRHGGGTLERPLHWRFGDAWAVRLGPWKLSGKGRDARSLVNLEEDPGEARNHLATDATRAGQLFELHQRWLGVVGDR